MGNLDKVSSNEVNDTIDKFKYNSTSDQLEAEVNINVALNFRGEYSSSEIYKLNDSVTDEGYLTMANKTTEDKPAPQAQGPEIPVYSPDNRLPQQVTARQLVVGQSYLFPQSGFVTGYELDVIAGNEYEIILVKDPDVTGEIVFINRFLATTSGIRSFNLIPRIVQSGTKFALLKIVSEPDPAPVETDLLYNLTEPTNTPVTLPIGSVAKSTKEPTIFRFHNQSNDSGNPDNEAYFLSLNPGDKISVSGIQYAVQGVSAFDANLTDIEVSPATKVGIDQEYTFTFAQVVEATISYGSEVDKWLGNANVRGVFGEDVSWGNAIETDDQYGVNLIVQDAYISPDWDLLSTSGVSATGGTLSSDDKQVLSQMVPTYGDDEGVSFLNQVEVQGEMIVGRDSYVDGMVALTTSDDVTYNDRTTILASDEGSSTPMWDGVTAGNTIYVGSDTPFSGVKIKINTDGVLDPQNIVAEVWDSDNLQWRDIGFMTTRSELNPFYQNQYGWSIAQNELGSEQWYFDFDPFMRYGLWGKSDVDGINKHWGRFRIITDITTSPILEQVKLHADGFEANSSGLTQFKGSARSPEIILSGVDLLIPNASQSPSSTNIPYATGVTAEYSDNRFRDGQIDSKLFVLNVPEFLDTSTLIAIDVSYFPTGIQTGACELEVTKIPIKDGFIYDGSAVEEGSFKGVTNIQISSSDTRFTQRLYLDIREADPFTTYMCVLRRNATVGNEPNDTLGSDIAISHIRVVGFKWRPN